MSDIEEPTLLNDSEGIMVTALPSSSSAAMTSTRPEGREHSIYMINAVLDNAANSNDRAYTTTTQRATVATGEISTFTSGPGAPRANNNLTPLPKLVYSGTSDHKGENDYWEGKNNWITGELKDIHDYYKVDAKKLGKGFFGHVVTGEHRASGDIHAIKVLSKLNMSENQIEWTRSEIALLSELDHPNIIKLYGVYETRTDVYLAMEMCTGGDLFGEILNQRVWEESGCWGVCCRCIYTSDETNEREKRPYTEKEAAYYIKEVLLGLEYLHANNIVHCDLHMQNILFADESLNSRLKIIDFGLSQKLRQARPDVYLSNLMGIVQYQAPEMLKGKYRKPCDMWSMGVITFHMIFGYRPFQFSSGGALRQYQINKHARKGFSPTERHGKGPWFPVGSNASEACKDFIAKLLVMDPAARISATEALNHPWIDGKAAATQPITQNVLTAIKDFKADHDVEKGLLLTMSDMLPENELEELKLVFDKLDYTKDGMISFEELAMAMEVLSKTKTKKEASALSKLTSKLKSASAAKGPEHVNMIHYDDLLSAALYQKMMAKKERLWHAFDRLDLDGSGHVYLSELKQFMPEDEAKEIMRKYDKDGKGIDLEEFLDMWKLDQADSKYDGKRSAIPSIATMAINKVSDEARDVISQTRSDPAPMPSNVELVQDMYAQRPDA